MQIEMSGEPFLSKRAARAKAVRYENQDYVKKHIMNGQESCEVGQSAKGVWLRAHGDES